MNFLRYWLVVFISLCWVFPAYAMFPDAHLGKPGKEAGKHLENFHWPPNQKSQAITANPRKKIALSQIYFRKPPLKGVQKKALREFQKAIPDFQVYFDQKTGLPIFLKGHPLYRKKAKEGVTASKINRREIALSALNAFKDVLRIKDPAKEFVFRKETIDNSGRSHLRFEQYWQGIHYFGKELVVHLDKDGNVYLISGRYAETPINLQVEPALSKEEAISIAVKDLKCTPKDIYHTELVIKEDNAGVPHLAWLIEVRHGVETWRYFIDAQCGQILEKYRLNYNIAVPGSGQDEQTGQIHHFSVWQENGQYFFIDTSIALHTRDPSVATEDFGAGNIVILNLPYGVAPPQGSVSWLTSTDPNLWPPAAVSVWYGLKETLDYYLRVHGRRGMDGNGSSAIGVIGLQEVNAYYSGGQQDFMYFGTGDGNNWGPLSSLDVVAHEFTHGVTNYTARLVYQFQSGALNEAFSDIFAAMIDREDWLIGEDVVRVPPYNMRDLSDPHNSLTPQPATMDEYRDLPFEDDNGGVHINATIPAHAAYLLSQDIGRDKAEKIFYRVLTGYMTPESEFRDFCLALTQAAEEIFGANSAERDATISACNKVGILQGEISGGEELPEVPPIASEDYILFLFLEPDFKKENFLYYLAELTPDGNILYVTEEAVHPTRPAPFYVQGTQYVLFIDKDYKLWSANIISETYEEYLLNDSGQIWSIATSPGTDKVVYTSTKDENIIYLWDPNTNKTRSYPIKIQPPDAIAPIETYFPDVVSLALDGYSVFFDCYNRIHFNEIEYEFWALGKLDLLSGASMMIFPVPMEGFHIGNPATAHTKPYLLAYDIWTEDWVETRILNLTTGRSGLVWQGAREEGRGTSGWPSFTGDDKYIILQDLQPDAAEILIAVPIQKTGETWEGNQAEAYIVLEEDPTGYGLLIPMVYRPGERIVRAKAEISTKTLNFGDVPIGRSKSLTITIRNTGNYPLEFRGSNIEDETVFQSKAVHTTIDPNQEYQVEIIFQPKEEKQYSTTLQIYLSDPELPEAQISLYGRGVEADYSLLGDISGDNQLNIIDALLVARCALHLTSCDTFVADVNCDNIVNIIDALLIARKSLNLPVSGWCQ